MTNPKKIRITCYLDSNVHEVLREVAHFSKRNKSMIINDALKHYLRNPMILDLHILNHLAYGKCQELCDLLEQDFLKSKNYSEKNND